MKSDEDENLYESNDQEQPKCSSLSDGTVQSCNLSTVTRNDLNQCLEPILTLNRPRSSVESCVGNPSLVVAHGPCLVDGMLLSKEEPYKTSVDAVHPFFTSYRNIKKDESTSTDNQMFYCRQCDFYIELCHEAVKQHFVTIEHTPIQGTCVYCKTGVYEYFYNENQYYYHKCPGENQSQNSTESSSNKKT